MDGRRLLLVIGAISFSALVGCGGGTAETPAPSTVTAASDAKPDHIVRNFLEAVRTGDDAKAAQMLTEVARRETEKHELVVAPPGSDTAHYEVGEVEYIEAGELAHVASKWTDVGENGQPHTDDIVWALRRDPAGWRIAGMATKIFPNEPPLLLDFEQPEEMMRQQRMAEEEIQRRAQAAQPKAVNAAKPAEVNVLRQ